MSPSTPPLQRNVELPTPERPVVVVGVVVVVLVIVIVVIVVVAVVVAILFERILILLQFTGRNAA